MSKSSDWAGELTSIKGGTKLPLTLRAIGT
jgi:hypothetical protein